MTTLSTNVWHIPYFDLTLRVLLSLLLGGLIGIEREWNNHAAGFRTHILVCLGSTTIMLLSIYGFDEFAAEPNVRMDPARLAAQVVSGIGFLGAGAIMRTGATISGLTTAASIWVVAAIGLCVGAGFYYGSIVVTVLVLVSLFVLNKWEKRLPRKRQKQELCVKTHTHSDILGSITTMLQQAGIRITHVAIETDSAGGPAASTATIRFRLHQPDSRHLSEAVERMLEREEVISIEYPVAALSPGTIRGRSSAAEEAQSQLGG